MPVIHSRHEVGETAIAPSPSCNPRPSIETRHLGVGCIVWLPSIGDDDDKRIKCIKESCCFNRELQDGGYNHPVVVLKVSTNNFGDVVCSIVKVTSKERNNRYDRIRISQERPSQLAYDGNDDATELYLEDGKMDKQSYVVLEHIFQIPASQLRSCSFRSERRAYNSRICEKSYTLLMARLGEKPEVWVPTIHLKFGGVTSSLETLRRQSREQSRTIRTSDDFITQHPAQYSSRADRATRQLAQPVTGTDQLFSSPRRNTTEGIFSSSHRYTEESLLLGTSASSRMSGVQNQQQGSRDSQYDAYRGYQTWSQPTVHRDSHYDVYDRRFGQSERVHHPEDYREEAEVPFKSIVVLMAVGALAWWYWHRK